MGKSSLKYCIMCYSCSYITFCSSHLSQNRFEVLFIPPKTSVLVRRKRKPTPCLIDIETCSFIFAKERVTMTVAEIIQERTRGNPGYFFISEMQIAARKGHFTIHESSVFFLSPSSEGINTVFVFCLGEAHDWH